MKIIFSIILIDLLLLVINNNSNISKPLNKSTILRIFPLENRLFNYENELQSTLIDVFQQLMKYTFFVLVSFLIIYIIYLIKCKICNALSRFK